MIIHNCIAAGGADVEVLRVHVDSNLDPRYEEYGGYHTGVDIACNSAYSLTSGQVLYIGTDGMQRSVIVQYSGDICVMYKNLDKVGVTETQIVSPKDYIGTCSNFLHIDLLTRAESPWAARVCGLTYYKQNPLSLVQQGQSALAAQLTYLYTPITDASAAMLSNNGGEDA